MKRRIPARRAAGPGENSLENLREDVKRMRAEWLKARSDLIEIISQAPGEIPQPDGALRIVQAGRKQLAALRGYKDAFDRHSDAVIKSKGGNPPKRPEPDRHSD
jgi:hypothetical protein